MRSITMKNAVLSLLALFLGCIPAISFAGSWNGWIYQDPYPTSVNLFDVKFVTPMKGWITGKYGTILYTEDGGENWEAQESGTEEDIMRVCFVNDKMGWAGGERGTIIHTEDGGKKWTTQYDIKALPTKIFFINEKEGWITGSNPIGVIYHTADSGKTWKKLETDIQRAIGSIYFHNSQIGWILAGEDVYRTTDGGKKWEKNRLPLSSSAVSLLSPMRRGPGRSMNEVLGYDWWSGDIVFTSEKNGWAVIFVFLFHTGDGGKTWAVQLDTGKIYHEFRHVSFRDTQNGCASGSSIYCTEDGGETWHERLGTGPEGSVGFGGINLTTKSYGWVVGNAGWILKTTDNGLNWKIPLKLNKCGRVPFFVNKKTGWLYDARNPNICRTDDGGQTWTMQDVEIELMDLFFLNDSLGWAVGQQKEASAPDKPEKVYGVIRQTKDGGRKWETRFIKELGAKTKEASIYNVKFIDPDIGWALDDSSTLFRTTDGGKHWQRHPLGFELYYGRIWFSDNKTGWIIGTNVTDHWTGFVLQTKDSGKQWQVLHKLKDVWLGDLAFTDKNDGWVMGEIQNSEVGVLFHTEDGGKIWSQREFENVGHGYLAFLDKLQGLIYSLNGFMLVTTDGGRTWNKRRVPLRKYPWHFSEIFRATDADTDLK